MTKAVELAQVASNGVSEAFKNRLINGNMVIDQRNAGAVVTAAGYCLDRWNFQAPSSRGNLGQNLNSITPPAGFTRYFGFQTTSAYTVGASESFNLQQPIEGFNVADLDWGTPNAKTVTLSFWVRSSLTGTFGGSVFNSAATWTFPFSYTITSANTWEYKTVTIVGGTNGSWESGNGAGIFLCIGLATGSSLSTTAGSWVNGFFRNVTGNTSIVGTNGATFYITGVQLEVGSSATNFETRAYGTEMILCQRYYQRNNSGFFASGRSSSACGLAGMFPVQMRASPDIGYLGAFTVFFPDVAGYNTTGIGVAGGTNTKGFYIDTLSLNGAPGTTRAGFTYTGENLAFSAEL